METSAGLSSETLMYSHSIHKLPPSAFDPHRIVGFHFPHSAERKVKWNMFCHARAGTPFAPVFLVFDFQSFVTSLVIIGVLLLCLAIVQRSRLKKSIPGENVDTLRSVINNLDAGVVIVGLKNKTRTYNPSAKKLLSDPQNKEVLTSFKVFYENVINDRILNDKLVVVTENDNPVRYIKMSARKLDNENAASIILLRDITSEKQVQEKLQEANRELDSFCYSISHDLRAPLRTINGFSRILLEDHGSKLDSEAVRLCNVIIKGGERMGSLIDDLLEFSRISKHEISPARLNMKALFHMAAGKLLSDEERKRIRLTINEMPEAWGDYDLIMQVGVNLLSNAIKYSSRETSPEIEAGADRNNGEITYWIRDNGVGFDMQYYDKLFEVFQRLHGRAEFEGTGVGLSIVDRIIKRHGGKVWARSSPGQGATFFFTLKTIPPTKEP